MEKRAIGRSFQLYSCKTLQFLFLLYVGYLMFLSLIHKLKCDTNLTLLFT